MGDQIVRLPWGNEEMRLSLPVAWRVAGVLEPSPCWPALDDVPAEVERSLAQPIGAPRLREMAHGGMKIALVVDDGSRPTPVAQLLPAILKELEAGAACADQITVVTALGLHRPMSQAEVGERIGAGPLAALRWENHDCDDPARLTFLGTTSRGTPVYINKTVAAADLIISVGCIEPHIIASFGGGYKNLIPGVAGRATVAHNHSLNCTPVTFNMVGQPIERNPMRLDLEEAGQMLKRPVFIVNAVLNSSLRVVRVVAGGPVAAHRAGVAVSASLYGVPAQPADVVITASHPMDQDLRQGVKALANTVRALKPGGVQLTLVRAAEGVGVFGLANRKLPLGKAALRRLAPVLVRLVPRLKLAGMGEEDRFFLYFALQAMQRGRLLIYGPTIPAAVQGNLPFVDFAPTPEAAIAAAAQRFPKHAEVLIFPHGGVTYPILG